MDYDFVVFQAESEITAINMVTGAAFAGIRAMTGTSRAIVNLNLDPSQVVIVSGIECHGKIVDYVCKS